MSLRDTLVMKDGKARPPQILRKVCVHNGGSKLEGRARGDMFFEIEYEHGIQREYYSCLQCGHTVTCEDMMIRYQEYMIDGGVLETGRRLDKIRALEAMGAIGE